MRSLCLLTWLAMTSACSSFGVHCDSRLRSINPRQPAVSRQQVPEALAAPKTSGPGSGERVKP